MSVDLQTINENCTRSDLIKYAEVLLSQQIWCWGCDIIRPKGNWLIDIGFKRIEPPENREDCPSVYSLELPRGQCVVLRGFGVFFGDPAHGGIFVPRYDFQPKYTTHATLENPPWSDEDLPALHLPAESERKVCAGLTVDLINWIHSYEVNVVEQLGVTYRQQTLTQWDNGKRPFIPAEQFATAWHALSFQIANTFWEKLWR